MELDSIVPAGTPPIPIRSCRSCAGSFTVECLDGRVVTILTGIPKDARYNAISHVWGDVLLHQLKCQRCGAIHPIPITSEAKFHSIMSFAAGNTIWLDVLSIDQTSHKDVQTQVAHMGKIYEGAMCVDVLLPQKDEKAYQLLDELTTAAKLLFKYGVYFEKNKNKQMDTTHKLSDICKKFSKFLKIFGDKINSWTYWRRAWTFQEWSMAHDITLGVEGRSGALINRVKSSIFAVALMIAEYKLEFGRHALIDVGFERAQVLSRFDVARRLFPYENALLSFDEIDDNLRRFQTFFPHYTATGRLGGPVQDARTPSRKTDDTRYREYAMGFGIPCDFESTDESPPPKDHPHEGTDQLLGIRLTPRRLQETRFQARLRLALDAFAVCRRKARYEADLVCSWASMCNISYDYRKDDTLEVAIGKVVTVLRSRGIKIFNFLVHGPPTGPRTAFDGRFLGFASTQTQCNANDRAYHPGAPIFTGRADTAALFRMLVHQTTATATATPSGVLNHPSVPLNQVEGAVILDCVVMNQKEKAMQLFREGIAASLEDLSLYNDCVNADAEIMDVGSTQLGFTDVCHNLTAILDVMKASQLSNKLLIMVALPFHRDDGSEEHARVWAIFSADDSTTGGALGEFVVAREDLNGTLVLVQKRGGVAQVMAYLMKTDHLYGTFLLGCTSEGAARWTLKTPRRNDMLVPQTLEDRVVTGNFPLSLETMYDGPVPQEDK